jgi:hypothetical protein
MKLSGLVLDLFYITIRSRLLIVCGHVAENLQYQVGWVDFGLILQF